MADAKHDVPIRSAAPTGGFVDTEDGFKLDPPLELLDPEEITFEVMQRGCLLLGIDPDDVWSGKDVELPENPPVMQTIAFLQLVVENAEEYNFARMQHSRVKCVLAVVTDHFINASRLA